MPGPSLLTAGWEAAKPAEATIGKVNFLGIADYATKDGLSADGFRGTPRAIIQQYSVGNNGETLKQTTAATYADLEQLAVENRRDLENGHQNPNSASNLDTIKSAYKNLDLATKSGMKLGPGLIAEDLIKLDKMQNPSLEELNALNKTEQRLDGLQKAPVQLSYDHNGIY